MTIDWTYKQIDDFHGFFLDVAINPESTITCAETYRINLITKRVDSCGRSLLEKIYERRLFGLLNQISHLGDYLIEPLLKIKDENGNSLLHIAVLKNDKEAIRILLNIFGINSYSLKNHDGKTAKELINDEKNPDVTGMFCNRLFGEL